MLGASRDSGCSARAGHCEAAVLKAQRGDVEDEQDAYGGGSQDRTQQAGRSKSLRGRVKENSISQVGPGPPAGQLADEFCELVVGQILVTTVISH